MIPKLIRLPGNPWFVLPEGVHQATLTEIADSFAYGYHRRRLFDGLVLASRNLARAKCRRLYLDGSYVTDKDIPADYDACWDPEGVDMQAIDTVFFVLTNGRIAQKAKFGGEFFPTSALADGRGRNIVDFFQIDKRTGIRKGIILIDLANDSALI